ncbi:MAG TPA: phosphatidate cytidylyltransferase [Ignavibacteria bacterium]|nr:phosphatidate cytidylyltransferase [Ignavibacteria bacterium]
MSVNNTFLRILVSAITIPLIIFISYSGGVLFFVFVMFISLLSYYEFTTFIKKIDISANFWVGFGGALFVLLNNKYHYLDTYTFVLLLILVLFFFELFRKQGATIANIGSTLIGVFYIGFFASTIIGIREIYPHIGNLYERGGYIIISIFVTIWVCDSAAFFGGTALGKHKLFPRVSPKKSWEGAVFGFLFAIGTMALAKVIVLAFLSWTTIIVIGFIIGVFGQIGDLIESLLKRSANVKDSSHLIPGHGGIFDRFDSLLFSAPIILLYLTYFSK